MKMSVQMSRKNQKTNWQRAEISICHIVWKAPLRRLAALSAERAACSRAGRKPPERQAFQTCASFPVLQQHQPCLLQVFLGAGTHTCPSDAWQLMAGAHVAVR